MSAVEWTKFLKGVLMLIVFAVALGAAIGACRGTMVVVERWVSGER